MKNSLYHYTECGLENIYLKNGYNFIETSRGKSVSVNDMDGLHRAIGLSIVLGKKDLSGEEVRFLRHELLLSQTTLARLLGVSEQAICRWENGKIQIPKPPESLLRLLYREHIHDREGNISTLLKQIADLEDTINDGQRLFTDTKSGWKAA